MFTHIPSLIRTLGILLVVLLTPQIFAQTQDQSQRETDPLVLKKLEWFQNMKFGLLMHWGPYSQWGVVESWSICSEDEPWCQRNMDDYVEYCKKYEQLKETFSPVKFDPDKWAVAAEYAGMKYVVFTTKHHDGFCMFDTKQTDYRITDPGCPFHSNPRANIAKEMFDAFRKQGFGIHIGHTLIAM
jgi:alpha-L-fucosidase